MKIVIPMSGVGQRFIDAGYKTTKALIEIDGSPIIEHVVNLFPGEKDFIFICNEIHIKNTNMSDILKRIAPNGRIITIPSHKLGPVYAISQVYDLIDDDEEVIVNYCDFGTHWNYNDFLEHTRMRHADGAVPAYKGFHPHMLGSTNYAFMRDKDQWMLEIQEKQPFTNDRMSEYASNGTYYFRTGEILKKYFDETLISNNDLKGEYYVSVVFNCLVDDGLKVSIYEIQHMLQWGTPADVEEYMQWSNYFSTNQSFLSRTPKTLINQLIIPMAGAGSRFVKEGFVLPKPLIKVNGKPMVVNAVKSSPGFEQINIAVLAEHEEKNSLLKELDLFYPNANKIILPELSTGQATTCFKILEDIPEDQSIFIAPCDSAVTWNESKFCDEIEENIDVLVFAFKNHPHANKNPSQYGWIEADELTLNLNKVSVKTPISKNPKSDFGIVGAFYFSKINIYNEAYKELLEANDTINGEYYIDSLINYIDLNKYKVKVFLVDDFICWGTPDDYKTFKYWQSYFHKTSHPYNLNSDDNISSTDKVILEHEAYEFNQEFK